MCPDKEIPWLINPDADLEIGSLDRSPGGYRTRKALRETIARQRFRFQSLVAGAPWLFDFELENAASVANWLGSGRLPEGRLVHCWSPTPGARRKLERLGLRPTHSVAPRTLRAVTSRTFAAQVPSLPWLPQRSAIRAWSEWSALRAESPGLLRIKPEFSCAGRGQRNVPLQPSSDDQRFIRDGLARGALIVEPSLVVEAELCVHGLTLAGGQELWLGDECVNATDRFGQPQDTMVRHPEDSALAPRHPSSFAEIIRECARTVGRALGAAGYSGPFGIDFLVGEGNGVSTRGPWMSEINARFTLGWSVGMGAQRSRALRRLLDASR